ncbi:MAG: hypothetical protein Q4D21_01610 [Phascolarctobacterium sp.]|nr:hypothetical protein [Phascolarctobacterium sp.]
MKDVNLTEVRAIWKQLSKEEKKAIASKTTVKRYCKNSSVKIGGDNVYCLWISKGSYYF